MDNDDPRCKGMEKAGDRQCDASLQSKHRTFGVAAYLAG
jgi:hypothetical protein